MRIAKIHSRHAALNRKKQTATPIKPKQRGLVMPSPEPVTEPITPAPLIGQFVLVRTYSAGVHCGVLESRYGKEVLLSDVRRIWRWRGANTPNEIASKGVDEVWTRISEPVGAVLLTEAIEVIGCTPVAAENLRRSRWGGLT
jgi:hypothetical protein